MSISNEDRQKRFNDQIEVCNLVQRFCDLQRIEIEQMSTFLYPQGPRPSLAEMRKHSLALREMHEELKKIQQEMMRLMQIT